ncbi:hypothetical protein LJC36_00050 [Desulfovibrio sp. OttesenSCG-928-C14]|nr:hypothetical protein [Desulfovibrio sp. OttesenSCG-928-C14]
MSVTRNDGHALLVELESEIAAKAMEYLSRYKALSPDQREILSAGLARHAADFLSLSWGGQQVYIPMDSKRRASMMYEEFDGANHAELARKFGVCIQTVYKVIKREHAARSGKQCSLLDL